MLSNISLELFLLRVLNRIRIISFPKLIIRHSSLVEVGIGSTQEMSSGIRTSMLRLILEAMGRSITNQLVTVEGATGVSTLTGQDFNAVVQPIVRGEIFSVDRVLGGVGYGASTVYNLERQPDLH